MNTTLNYILIFLCFVITSCKIHSNKSENRNPPIDNNKIEGLTQISDKWKYENSTYWSRDKDSTWIELNTTDTLSYPEYTITNKYILNLKNEVSIKKMINIDPKSKNINSETDLYTKKLSSKIESKLRLSFDYNTKKYYADFLDSTRIKILKVDSLTNVKHENGWTMCGTAQMEMQMEEISLLRVPTEIDKDSAFSVIKDWIKE